MQCGLIAREGIETLERVAVFADRVFDLRETGSGVAGRSWNGPGATGHFRRVAIASD